MHTHTHTHTHTSPFTSLATSQMSKESIITRQDKMDQVEQNAAGAAAGVGEKRRRESPTLVLPSGSEWENLVADIGALHLRDFRAGDTRLQQSQLPPSRSDDSLYLARRKCVSDVVHEGVQISLPRTAAAMSQHGSGAPGRFYSGYGVEDDDDDSGLGAPPPAPPTLKRTRACSSSPKRRRKFRDDEDFLLQ